MNGQKLETVTNFKYLGSVITDEGSKPEILSRIAQTTAALTRVKPVWNDRCVSLSSKIRLMLRISYKDPVTNKEVCAKMQQTVGLHEDLTIVKRCKLQWYGHVSRSPGLAKTLLHGTVKGGRRQRRQRKRWQD